MIEDLTTTLMVPAEGFVEDDTLRQIKYVFSQMLELDGASEKGPENQTLLHLVSRFLECKDDYSPSKEVFELIISLVEIIIRHGCPLEARDNFDYTAKQFTEHLIEEGYINYEQ